MRLLAWQRYLVLAVKIGIGIGLVTWLLSSGRLELSRLAAVRLTGQLEALFAAVVCSMCVPAVRWWWLLHIQGLPQSLITIVRITWVGYLAALALPGAASGDLAKSILILKDNRQARARAFSTVLADRFLGLYSLMLPGAVSAAWMAYRDGWDSMLSLLMMGTLISLVASTAGIAALLYPGTRSILLRFFPSAWRDSWEESFGFYVAGWRHLAGCFGLSIANAMLTSAIFVLASRSLGQNIAWDTTYLVGPLVVIANWVPFAPGGIGVAESVASELFERIGNPHGAEVMTLTRICAGVVSLAGLACVFLKGDSVPQGPGLDLQPVETKTLRSTFLNDGGE